MKARVLSVLLCHFAGICVFIAGDTQAALSGTVVTWGWGVSGPLPVPAAVEGGVVAVAAGTQHVLALKEDGAVVAWGGNYWGEGTVPLAARSGVRAIAAGVSLSVALKSSGSVIAWGYNIVGQTNVPVTAQSGVTAISAGAYHTVGLKNDGSVIAWGYNNCGQTNVPVAAQSGVTAIAAGLNHTVALKQDGSIVAWGEDLCGQTTVPLAAQSGVVAIAAGGSNTVALKTNGSVIVWGDNLYGQTNVPFAAQSGVKSVAVGCGHVVALKTNGTLVAWGNNHDGQAQDPPVSIIEIKEVSAGLNFTVAIVIPAAHFITRQPMSQSVLAGNTVSFSVAASGYALRYQWCFEGHDIPGATSTSLTLQNVSTEQAGNYSVIITNSFFKIGSAVARLLVNYMLPAVGVRSADGNCFVGDSLEMYAWAWGAPPPTFQWQFNGANLQDQTNSWMALPNVQASQNGDYTVVASNSLGAVTSSVVKIRVLEPVPVLAVVAEHPPPLALGTIHWLGARVTLPPPLKFQWQFNGIAMPNETNAWLLLVPVQQSSAGNYTVVATSSSGSFTSPPLEITVFCEPPSMAKPYFEFGNPYALVGSDVTLAARYEGSPAAIQWRFNGADLNGETNYLLSLLSVTESQAGQYSFTASNSAGMTISLPVTLVVGSQTPVFAFQPTSQAVVEGNTARFEAQVLAGPPASYLLLRDGTNVAVPFTYTLWGIPGLGGFSLLGTTVADSGDYRIVASNYLGSVTSVVASLTVTAAGPLDRWTQRNPLPQSHALFAVARGTNQYVAVGDRGTILTSSNGSNWAVQSPRVDLALNGIAYGGGIFVAVGEGGTILSSADGTNWAYRYTAPSTWFNAITYGNGRFVVVGSSPMGGTLVMNSTDGINWDRILVEGAGASACVAYANGLFVAGGSSILVSTDGTDWTLVQTVSRTVESIDYAAGVYVAVGDDGATLTSTDGMHWDSLTPVTNRRLLGVSYGQGRFVAVGARGTLLSSPDGRNWVPIESGTPDRLETVVFAGDHFVAAGENGTILTSTDGSIWTKENFGITRDLDGMDLANGTVVIVGKGGSILTSIDGTNYVVQNSGLTNDLHGVTWGGGLWVAVGEPGILLTSSNALVWVIHQTGTTNSLKDGTYANGQWIIVGTQGTIVRSTNAVDWDTTFTDPAYDLNAITFGNGVFLIAGDGPNSQNGSLFRSADGVNWSFGDYVGKNLRNVTFVDGMFLFPANDGQIFYSVDGRGVSDLPTNPEHLKGDNLRALNFSGGVYTVVGNDGKIFTSTDKVNWTPRASRTFENLHQVTYLDGKLITIGNSGTILQSARFVTELGPPAFVPGVGFQIPFNGIVNQRYRIQATTNLVDWVDLNTVTNGTESSHYMDSDPIFYSQRYYRLVAP